MVPDLDSNQYVHESKWTFVPDVMKFSASVSELLHYRLRMANLHVMAVAGEQAIKISFCLNKDDVGI